MSCLVEPFLQRRFVSSLPHCGAKRRLTKASEGRRHHGIDLDVAFILSSFVYHAIERTKGKGENEADRRGRKAQCFGVTLAGVRCLLIFIIFCDDDELNVFQLPVWRTARDVGFPHPHHDPA